mmetsp:Transcript_21462/g.53556  ORF Transcript_21462/g.53556 Transcript_21462/m.53556 type:complete len:201 (-) Transcript_21462:297-899(-)
MSARSSSSAFRRIACSITRRFDACASANFSAASRRLRSSRCFTMVSYSSAPRFPRCKSSLAAAAFCTALFAKFFAAAKIDDPLPSSNGSNFTTASCPPFLARSRALSPAALRVAGFAPALSRSDTTSACPALAAAMSEVVPSAVTNPSGCTDLLRHACTLSTAPSSTASKIVCASWSLSRTSEEACSICGLPGSTSRPRS